MAVGAFIFMITSSEDPEVVHTDPAELGAYLAHACNQHGYSEFYLPYCTATGHGGGGSDGVFQQGLWHGNLYYNWDNAYGEAYQHLIKRAALERDRRAALPAKRAQLHGMAQRRLHSAELGVPRSRIEASSG